MYALTRVDLRTRSIASSSKSYFVKKHLCSLTLFSPLLQDCPWGSSSNSVVVTMEPGGQGGIPSLRFWPNKKKNLHSQKALDYHLHHSDFQTFLLLCAQCLAEKWLLLGQCDSNMCLPIEAWDERIAEEYPWTLSEIDQIIFKRKVQMYVCICTPVNTLVVKWLILN